MLGHRFQTDCLILNLPGEEDRTQIGTAMESPSMATLAEALLAGTARLLEIEPFELSTFARPPIAGRNEEQIVFYENVPGGAGYLQEMARRLPESSQSGGGIERLARMLHERRDEVRLGTFEPGTGRYRKGAIEEPLRRAIAAIEDLPEPNREYEYRRNGSLVTVPDFAWEDVRLAVYCDGFAFHGNRDTLELDAQKRNWLQSEGWTVLTYWGRTILKDADGCAQQIVTTYRGIARRCV